MAASQNETVNAIAEDDIRDIRESAVASQRGRDAVLSLLYGHMRLWVDFGDLALSPYAMLSKPKLLAGGDVLISFRLFDRICCSFKKQ